MSLSKSGYLLATGSEDNTIKLWDMVKLTELITLKSGESEIQSVKFSPNGKLLLSGHKDGTITVWDVSKIEWEEK